MPIADVYRFIIGMHGSYGSVLSRHYSKVTVRVHEMLGKNTKTWYIPL